MRRDGIALLLTVGILVLLSLAGVGMIGLASQLRAGTFLRLEKTQAVLVARSGVEYASVRLAEDAAPRSPATAGNQADDWTYRDDSGVALEKTRNPSYAQGEPYTDLPENGKYDFGGDPYRDLDGNGRFDSWSGRLRGGAGTGAVFLLKVASEGSKIDVNAGLLGMEDVNRNGIPDYRDIDPRDEDNFPLNDTALTYETAIRNVRIADTLNLLGQALGGGEALMKAGSSILERRPPGGYGSLEEIRKVLSPADWEKIRGYLGLSSALRGLRRSRFFRDARVNRDEPEGWPNSTPPSAFSAWEQPPWVYRGPDKVSAIDLRSADRPLLQALFSGLAGASLPPGQTNTSCEMVHLGFLDAGRVADFLLKERPFANRYDLFARLESAKGLLFPLDDPWSQSIKVNLVAANAEDDPSFGPDREEFAAVRVPLASDFPSFSWCSYDLPRTLWPGGETRMERTGVQRRWAAPLPVPDQIATGPAIVLPGTLEKGSEHRDMETLPLSLDPAGVFRVESLGRAGKVSSFAGGTLRVSNAVFARSQADFENLTGRSILEDGVETIGRPFKAQIQTYPRFPLDSCRDLAGWPPGGFPSQYRFPDDYGTIALMAYTGYEAGPENEQFFYQPCWEMGQPLRAKLAPALAPDSAENFKSVFPGSPSPQPSQASMSGVYRHDDLGTEVLFPCLDGVRGYYRFFRDPATTAVLLPSTEQFTWPEGNFPWFDGNGQPKGGTVDFWAGHLIAGLVYKTSLPTSTSLLGFGLTTSNAPIDEIVDVYVPRADSSSHVFFTETVQQKTAIYRSIRPCAPGTYHRVVFTIDGSAEAMTGYIDGIPDPGLATLLLSRAEDPTSPITLRYSDVAHAGGGGKSTASGFNRGLGMRLYEGVPFSPVHILARSQAAPFYWNPEADPPLAPEVPSFVSPLYRFPKAVRLTGARWEGFVPEPIRKASEDWNAGHPGDRKYPIAVELWAYRDVDGTQGKRVLSLLGEGGMQGGGGTAIDLKGVRSLRYRIAMDASAVVGFNNETPVINSIGFHYSTSGKWMSWEEKW